MPVGAPDATLWFGDPQIAAAFPTDREQVFYVAMPTKDRLAEFRPDPGRALVSYVADFPEAPPIRSARLVGEVLGKLEMPNRVRTVTGPGSPWSATPRWRPTRSSASAVGGPSSQGSGSPTRSPRRWAVPSRWSAACGTTAAAMPCALRGHAFFIHDYATGRRMNPAERFLFAAGARDERAAATFDRYATRQIGPARMFASALPRALVVNARHALRGSGAASPRATAAPSGAAAL